MTQLHAVRGDTINPRTLGRTVPGAHGRMHHESAVTACQVVDRDQYYVGLDIGPAMPGLIRDLIRALRCDPVARTTFIGTINGTSNLHAGEKIEQVGRLANHLDRTGATLLILDPVHADHLADDLSCAASEPEHCANPRCDWNAPAGATYCGACER